MKHCRDYLEKLCAYVDGEADDAACKEIETHLKDCEGCRVMVDTLRKTVFLCREGDTEPIPIALGDKLKLLLDRKWREKFGDGDGEKPGGGS
ncbi:MAG: zf-HC2 domain-containing protein [Candidatus Krumholzibacteriota bacterium]|nr:zf-HC2 domain-containing protein [Candidatus Krumholzibacteriota bacterium]